MNRQKRQLRKDKAMEHEITAEFGQTTIPEAELIKAAIEAAGVLGALSMKLTDAADANYAKRTAEALRQAAYDMIDAACDEAYVPTDDAVSIIARIDGDTIRDLLGSLTGM